MSNPVDDVCNDLVAALHSGGYAPGVLVQLAGAAFDPARVAKLENNMQSAFASAVILLGDGYATSGYRERCCDLGAVGGPIIEQFDAAMADLRDGLTAALRPVIA